VNAGPVQDLVARGAVAAASPAEVAQRATTIITMLPAPKIVDDLFTGDAGLLASAAAGTLFIDCSTIDPGTAQRVAAASAARGLRFVDAPVSGGVIGAANATLTFMAGGDAAAVAEAEKVLLHMGKSVVHCGESGAGQVAKLCNNLLLGITMGGVCEAMQLGTRLGVGRSRPPRVRPLPLRGPARRRARVHMRAHVLMCVLACPCMCYCVCKQMQRSWRRSSTAVQGVRGPATRTTPVRRYRQTLEAHA
jgi:3-hydroxyisobutyrate dehydrogenase-like beta-hydroxyacid dehydrogenase